MGSYKKQLVTVFEHFEDTNMALGQMYRKEGRMSEKMETALTEFCEKMREVFEKDPEKFNFKKVYEALEDNLWVPRHKNYIHSRKK